MDIQPKTILIYQANNGRKPFDDWYLRLKNPKAKLIIRKRINQIALGNLGDCKAVKDDMYELRINDGPGYRLYFAMEEMAVIVLLLGGDKSTQKEDIQKAEEYYNDYKSRS